MALYTNWQFNLVISRKTPVVASVAIRGHQLVAIFFFHGPASESGTGLQFPHGPGESQLGGRTGWGPWPWVLREIPSGSVETVGGGSLSLGILRTGWLCFTIGKDHKNGELVPHFWAIPSPRDRPIPSSPFSLWSPIAAGPHLLEDHPRA